MKDETEEQTKAKIGELVWDPSRLSGTQIRSFLTENRVPPELDIKLEDFWVCARPVSLLTVFRVVKLGKMVKHSLYH